MKKLTYLLKRYRQLRLLLKSSRLLLAWVLCVALSSVAPACLAQTSVFGSAAGPSEEQVKAAYLLRFIGYVEWPASAFSKPDSPYVVGILHADGIAEELTVLAAGKAVSNRPVIIKRLQANDSFDGLHVLFVGAAERGRQPQWLKSLQQQPVLLVTETEEALTQGSMINFQIVEDRVRFEVALEPAGRSGLKINSRMLGVALSVIKGPQ
jgi:hypothetical protein